MSHRGGRELLQELCDGTVPGASLKEGRGTGKGGVVRSVRGNHSGEELCHGWWPPDPRLIQTMGGEWLKSFC